MARLMTPRDAHALVNLLVKEATGQTNTIQVVDSSSFASAGELILATGVENTLNALSIVIAKTLIKARPYSATFRIVEENNTGLYAQRVRKISFYSKDAERSGDWNTDQAVNLANGFDNGNNGGQSTASMWQQNQPVPLEMNFAGQSVWEDSITRYENQLKVAFTSEADFISFVAGYMQEKANDIESQKEAFNRMALLNQMAGVYDLSSDMPGSVVNLTAEFNTAFGTSYTSAQLRTTYIKEFTEFMTATIKKKSIEMRQRSVKFHWSPAKTVGSTAYKLLRFTPKDSQRLILLKDLVIDAEALVMPEIFNTKYLNFNEQAELVDYWQNINDKSAIKVIPAIPDTTTGVQKAGDQVALSYVVGALYDKDAVMINHQLETARTTPVEARKGYMNTWFTFSKNVINDFTENFILFTMED